MSVDPNDCYTLLSEFISIVDPPSLSLLPPYASSSSSTPPIEEWTSLHTIIAPKPGIRYISVKEHRTKTGRNYYVIVCEFEDVDAEAVWALLARQQYRKRWDATCEYTEVLESKVIDNLDVTVDYVRLDGIFPVVKPRDLCLLTTNTRLPPLYSTPLRHRFVSASKSTTHPSTPTIRTHFRFEPSVSGLLVEQDGMGGVYALQLADLGSLAAWVPSYIMKLVCHTLVPRNLQTILEAARLLGEELGPEHDLPPLLAPSASDLVISSPSKPFSRSHTIYLNKGDLPLSDEKEEITPQPTPRPSEAYRRLSYILPPPSKHKPDEEDDEEDEAKFEALEQVFETDEGMEAAQRMSMILSQVEDKEDEEELGDDGKEVLRTKLEEAARPFTLFLSPSPPKKDSSSTNGGAVVDYGWGTVSVVIMSLSSVLETALYAPWYAFGYGKVGCLGGRSEVNFT